MHFHKNSSAMHLVFVVFLLNLSRIYCLLNLTKFSRNQISFTDDNKYDLNTISLKISEKLMQASFVELGIHSMQVLRLRLPMYTVLFILNVIYRKYMTRINLQLLSPMKIKS